MALQSRLVPDRSRKTIVVSSMTAFMDRQRASDPVWSREELINNALEYADFKCPIANERDMFNLFSIASAHFDSYERNIHDAFF